MTFLAVEQDGFTTEITEQEAVALLARDAERSFVPTKAREGSYTGHTVAMVAISEMKVGHDPERELTHAEPGEPVAVRCVDPKIPEPFTLR